MKLISKNVIHSFVQGDYLYFIEEVKNSIKYYRYGKDTIEDILESEYYSKFYGTNYKKIIYYFGNSPTQRSFGEDGSLYVCFFQESKIYKFDNHGSLNRVYESMGCYDTIYDILIEGNSIWCAYPTSHTIKRFFLETEELEVVVSEGTIGGDRGTIFCYPETITRFQNDIYVADMGNKRICKVDLSSYKTKEYLKFESNVYGYERTNDMEFVWLKHSNHMYLISQKSSSN